MLLEIDNGRVKFPKTMPQIWLLIGFYFSTIWSNAVHTYFQGFLNTYIETFKFCFYTMLLLIALDSAPKLRAVARVFVALAVVMAVHCLLQETRGYGFVGLRPMLIGPVAGNPAYYRSYFFGIFGDPNDTGQMLVTAVPFSFVVFKRKGLLPFLVGCGISYLLIKALYTTHSRGAEVGLFSLIGMLVVLKLPQRWMPTLVPLGMIGVLAICPVMAQGLDMSARERIIMWGFSNQYLFAHPLSLLFGVGCGQSYIIADIYSMRGLTMHNMFVYCYTELGYFGFIFWFGLILIGMMSAWKVRVYMSRQRKTDRDVEYIWRYAGYAMCAMVSFCGSGYFLSRAYVYPIFFLMAILAALPRVADQYLYDDGEVISLMPDMKASFSLAPVGAAFGMVYVWLSCIMLNKGV